MKKVKISLPYDSKRSRALKMYMADKGLSVVEELTKTLDSLYTKVVPADVRKFIERESENDEAQEVDNES